MPRIKYIDHSFSNKSETIIFKANEILNEYAEQGFDLTLRQLYYQFVARGLIPNTQREYKNLGSIINDARLAGEIDWDHICDRTRNLEKLSHWNSPEEIISVAARTYMLDKWENQKHRVEVWIEKDALIGVIEDVCKKLDVPYFSCRGYTSQSEMWRAAERIREYIEQGQIPIILHLGDHDPSGIDMTRDILSRLTLFIEMDPVCSYAQSGFELIRIALNRDQIKKYKPPPNPAKISDSRAKMYIVEHGYDSWELDALEPSVIEKLIYKHVRKFIDTDSLGEILKREICEKQVLSEIAERIKQ